ncbi:MAG: A/G-specific adenine glycosylase [Pseudomonadota bacterium]
MTEPFSHRVLRWAKHSGRKHLPWQQHPTPYRVWVSEIMLQQTQVDTVIPYYEKFMQSFADIDALANASQDDVLHHWSGLGYYARARNLHKTAQIIRDQYHHQFPLDIDEVIALPGIGKSTAAAILSLSHNQRHAILDGNVKRVLARHTGTPGWPGLSKVEKKLWQIAEQRTPNKNNARYTQAMMDLGAMICTRRQPLCPECPVQEDCIAQIKNLQASLPAPKPKKKIPTREVVMLLVINQKSDVLMQRRPNTGLWGGLWSFPEFETQALALQWCSRMFHQVPDVQEKLAKLTHTFSHFKLIISPITLRFHTPIHWVMEADDWVWYKKNSSRAGLAAPVDKLIKQIA